MATITRTTGDYRVSEQSEVQQRTKDLVDMFDGEGVKFNEFQVQRIQNALYLAYLEGQNATLREQLGAIG